METAKFCSNPECPGKPCTCFLAFTPVHNNTAALEAAEPDECIEETYFRLIIESPTFDAMNSEDREMFLLELAQNCVTWVQQRRDY